MLHAKFWFHKEATKSLYDNSCLESDRIEGGGGGREREINRLIERQREREGKRQRNGDRQREIDERQREMRDKER